MQKPASLRQLIIGFAFDFLILSGYLVILAAIFLPLTFGPMRSQMTALASTPLRLNLLAFCTTILPFTLYFSLQESSPAQATWGKSKAGIRVATLKGERVKFWRTLLRSVAKFLPWQIAHTCIFFIPNNLPQPGWVMAGLVLAQVWVVIYLLVLWLNKTHRTPYDWIARTEVIQDDSR